MCGEKMMKAGSNCAMLGSPPRMRGKVHCSSARTAAAGITPAYAGKSSEHTQRSGTSGDHPRVCGEKRLMVVMEYAAVGSPPRMRGKARPHPMGTLERRITPAYAGKSPCLPVVLPCCEDHPRVCGEKRRPRFRHCLRPGSPPRMRGKVHCGFTIAWCKRITPAYAGKRLKRSRSTVSPVAIVPLFPSVCNKPVVSDGSPAVRDAPLFLPAENAVPASPACNLRSL